MIPGHPQIPNSIEAQVSYVKWHMLSHSVLTLATSWTSLPDSSVHGILQGRIMEWVAMPSSRGSS